jgi:hypothetical protein
MTSGTRCTASPACFTTVVATRFARATGDCRRRVRFRPPLRFRPDERRAEPRADDFRRDDLRADDFRPEDFLRDDFRPLDLRRVDFLPADFRPPRRPPDLDLPRDDRLFVAMALRSK